MAKSRLMLKNYPYTTSRVKVMRRTLLDRNDYIKLLKMGVEEISKFLGDTNYRKEIDRLAVNFLGADLIEHALALNMSNTMAKLRKISSEEVRALIDIYLRRWDIYNIKTILRGKFTGSKEEEILGLLVPAGALGMEQLKAAMEAKSVRESLSRIKFLDQAELKKAVDEYEESNNLSFIENKLDSAYYSQSLKSVRTLTKEAELFRNFISNEIDVLNIRTLMMAKKNSLSSELTRKSLFFSGRRLKKDVLERMAATKDIGDLLSAIEQSYYGSTIKKEIDEAKKTGSVIAIDNKLSKSLIEESFVFSHKSPLSALVILSFMLAKEIEFHNLRKIARGKALGLDESFIEKQIVV